MKYKIFAPNADYKREVMGLQFVNGVAETDNDWAAAWFSGRNGFQVETKKKKQGAKNDGTGDSAATASES